MTLYIDRLPAEAAKDFRCWRRANRYTLDDFPANTAEELDATLIAFARECATLDRGTRHLKLTEAFDGEHHADVEAVLDQIIADLDSDAEVAGEPVEKEAPFNFRFIFAQIDGASPEQVETFAKMIGGIIANRG